MSTGWLWFWLWFSGLAAGIGTCIIWACWPSKEQIALNKRRRR